MSRQVRIDIPVDVQAILGALQSAGYPAYLVGGSVRDSLRIMLSDTDFMEYPASGVGTSRTAPLLRRSPQPSPRQHLDMSSIAQIEDWDIASAAQPEQLAQVLSTYRVIATGEAFGTMTVLTDQRPVQITTFRADGTYSDNRHPDQVQFSRDITDDLARRDFTINAMAYSHESGLIDPFGGQFDLKSRTLRAVGQAEQRLAEDALRIMRALRFAATLGFTIDDELREALHRQKGLLAQISPERIQVELMKMLEADGQQLQTVLLEYGDVLAVPIPEIAPMIGMDQLSPWHAYDVWEHSVRALAASDTSDRYVRLALLLHDIGKPATFTIDANGRGHFYAHAPAGADIAAKRLEALRFDRQTIEITSELVRAHFAPTTAETILKWLRRFGEQQLRRLIKVKQADMQAHIDTAVGQGMAQLQKALDALDQAIAEEACFSLKQLSIGGDDLISIGFTSGPELGATLEALLDAVIEGQLPNDREALLEAAKRGMP